MKQKCKVLMMFMGLVCLVTPTVFALELVTEVRIEAASGQPDQEDFTFSGAGFEDFVLEVKNGADDGSGRVSSALVKLNGQKILGPSDFNQKVDSLERAIAPLETGNTLSVTVRSNPGSFLHIRILGEPTLDLPPDPGSAGEATIEGIDSNGNGVRDDVERWIALNYRNSEKTRLALTQAYYPLQNFMIHARQGDRDAVYNDMTALQRASECLHYIHPDDAYLYMRELKANILNTSDRVYAYRDSSRMLGGGSFPSAAFSKWNQSCTFDPDALVN